ncbi:MAG TPA: NACHT domain-containing protein [Candidatus Wunengus sp. YC65]|uniref:NACHT domain-containing protein n=1 Tax=Candidatus Wunengus sp. YC65 TaxID=3367701 RepID=UPI0040252341
MEVLDKIGPVDINTILTIMNQIYDNISLLDSHIFFAYYFCGGEPDLTIFIKWVGSPEYSQKDIEYDEGKEILRSFAEIWEPSKKFHRIHEHLEKQTAMVIDTLKEKWEHEDVSLLERHALNLKDSTHGDSIRSVISTIKRREKIIDIAKKSGAVWLGHGLFWLTLIFGFSRSPKIQAVFFWNPWVRRIAGFGYVSFALTWIPFFRRKLLAPFKNALLSDAHLESFDSLSYFEESEIKELKTGETKPIKEAITQIRGQIVLEGESGLGKTMFLRFLIKCSKRIVVYLPADRCSCSVVEAIQNKLLGLAKDPSFLKSLIYAGAIDICIDGLNEITADTRSTIKQFAEVYSKGNIIMATQPLEWNPPSNAKIYTIQPLTQDKIESFLITRKQGLLHDMKTIDSNYEESCKGYLEEVFKPEQPKEVLNTTKRILSNPMDLTLVAQMIACGQKPDLFHLQEQQYKTMAEHYKNINVNQEFPLQSFSETVYNMRLNDKNSLPEGEFNKEFEAMEKYKMVVVREFITTDQGSKRREYFFRHDKIMEFFIVQAFLGKNNERPNEHFGDPRFRGVYFLLVYLLPKPVAEKLREHLVNYAADTKDHTVSDTFVQLFRSRKVISKD